MSVRDNRWWKSLHVNLRSFSSFTFVAVWQCLHYSCGVEDINYELHRTGGEERVMERIESNHQVHIKWIELKISANVNDLCCTCWLCSSTNFFLFIAVLPRTWKCIWLWSIWIHLFIFYFPLDFKFKWLSI